MNGLFWEGDINAYFLGHQAEEIFKSRIYDPYVYGRKDLTIIDVGGNLGLFTIYAQPFAKQIYTIEPSGEHIKVINKMVEFNEFKNVRVCQFALSSKDGEEKFYHYNNKTMYSLYGNIAQTPGSTVVATGEEIVKLKRLDTFFKEENIEHVDFMKLDVEGVEFEITGSDSFKNVASKIDTIVCEVHTFSGRNPNQILDAFKNNGFKVKQIPGDATLLVATRL